MLQAADILLYQADYVPVGEDQRQHIELTRDLAQRFNTKYGQTFQIPEAYILKTAAKINDLQEATAKMSKSATGAGHRVGLLDPPDRIRKTIMKATTDSNSAVDLDTMGPGVKNLLAIYQAFTGWTNDQMRAHFTGMRYGDLKKQVAEATIASLEPMQQRYRDITADPAYLDGILQAGADAVTPIANSTVRLVKERMGIYTPSR